MKPKNYEEIFNDIDKQFFDILKYLMNEKEISKYKTILIVDKLRNLEEYYRYMYTYIIYNDNKKIKKAQKLYNFFRVIFLLSFSSIFINFLWGLVLVFLMYFAKVYAETILNEKNDENVYINEILEKADKIEILIDNCYTFINDRRNVDVLCFEGEMNKLELRVLEETLKSIDNAVENGMENTKFNYEYIAVKILQDDLQTEEENLENLIEMARNKLNENLQINDDLSLVRIKNDEK